METRPEVKAALFWYRNPAGPVTAIDKLPIPIPSTERSQAAKVRTYPGSSFTNASPTKVTQAPLYVTERAPFTLCTLIPCDWSLNDTLLLSGREGLSWNWKWSWSLSSPLPSSSSFSTALFGHLPTSVPLTYMLARTARPKMSGPPDASCPSSKTMDRRFTVLFLMSVRSVPFLKASSGNVPPQRRRCQPVPEKSKSGGGELQPRK